MKRRQDLTKNEKIKGQSPFVDDLGNEMKFDFFSERLDRPESSCKLRRCTTPARASTSNFRRSKPRRPNLFRSKQEKQESLFERNLYYIWTKSKVATTSNYIERLNYIWITSKVETTFVWHQKLILHLNYIESRNFIFKTNKKNNNL